MPTIVWDLIAFTGAAALIYGVSLIWPPLAWIAAGAVLLSLGLWGARAAARERRNQR